MKNILITGSSGYIGANLMDYIRSCGDHPIPYDIKNGIYCNICDMESLHSILYNQKVDEVYHLAALPGIKVCEDELDSALNINVTGTWNVALNCYGKQVPFVFASSFAVNGGHGVYADTKYLAERFTLYYGGRVCRISNVFGGKDYLTKKNTVIAKLFNGTFKLEGDGNQTRDFIHVDDVCKAMVDIMKEPSGIYSISSGITTSINNLVCLYDVMSNNIVDFEKAMRGRYNHPDNRCWRKLV